MPTGTSPLVPASYDLVWTVVVIAVLAALVLGVVLLVRALRRPTGPGVVDRVESLRALRDSGAISEEEYAARKDRLLDRL